MRCVAGRCVFGLPLREIDIKFDDTVAVTKGIRDGLLGWYFEERERARVVGATVTVSGIVAFPVEKVDVA